MTRWAFMQTMRRILTQVRPIEYHGGWHACRTVPILPPALDELALIDHMVCQPSPDKRKVPVPIDCADSVARPSPTDTMHPIDPIQALHDPHSAPARGS